MQNMIQLPQDLYDAVRKKAAAQKKTTDALVIEWVSEHLDESETSEITQVFEQEVAAFERMRSDLLAQYAGQFVVIYQGQVVASGSEKLALLDEVREQYGNVVCYVEKVASDSPRTVRMPSVRVARS
jgi:ABC-type cobalamin/Fe3+-siderophores transport system ATPase subunit